MFGLFSKVSSTDRALSKLSETLTVNSLRCVNFRTKERCCEKCVVHCPTSAISLDYTAKKVNINWLECTECGICVSVCPTQVFDLKQFPYIRFVNSIAVNTDNTGYINFFCSKVKCVEEIGFSSQIPCLGYLDFSLIIWLIFHQQYKYIHLHMGDCNSCKAKYGKSLSAEYIKVVRGFIDHFGDTDCIKVTQNIGETDDTILTDENCTVDEIKINNNDITNLNLSRRELFKLFRRNTKQLTGKALVMFAEDNNSIEGRNEIVHNKGKIDIPSKRFILIKALASNDINILNDLYNSFNNDELTNITIDMEKCNLCGLCYLFCPTGALVEKNKKDKDGISRKDGIDLDIIKCLKCNLCITLCRKDAIEYNPVIDINNLLKNFSLDDSSI